MLLISGLSSTKSTVIFFSAFAAFISSFSPELLSRYTVSATTSGELTISKVSSGAIISLESSTKGNFTLKVVPLFWWLSISTVPESSWTRPFTKASPIPVLEYFWSDESVLWKGCMTASRCSGWIYELLLWQERINCPEALSTSILKFISLWGSECLKALLSRLLMIFSILSLSNTV